MSQNTPGCGFPIDDLNAGDVFDVLLHPQDRVDGCLALLFLDGDGYLLGPFIVGEPPSHTSRDDRVLALRGLLDHSPQAAPAIAVARGRRGSLTLTDEDREWHEILLHVAATTGVRMVGMWLATPAGVRTLPRPLLESRSA